MKQVLFLALGIVVGLFASPVMAPALTSSPILNTSAVYIELLALVPGEGPVSIRSFLAKWA